MREKTIMKCPNGHEEKALIQIFPEYILCRTCNLFYNINEMLIELTASMTDRELLRPSKKGREKTVDSKQKLLTA